MSRIKDFFRPSLTKIFVWLFLTAFIITIIWGGGCSLLTNQNITAGYCVKEITSFLLTWWIYILPPELAAQFLGGWPNFYWVVFFLIGFEIYLMVCLLFFLVSLLPQIRKREESAREKKKLAIGWLLLIFAVTFIILFFWVLTSFPNASCRSRDTRIRTAVAQFQTLAQYQYEKDGNYDALNCSMSEAQALCDDVEKNISTFIDVKPGLIVAKNQRIGSTVFCAFSPLDHDTARSLCSRGIDCCLKKLIGRPLKIAPRYWVCVDSSGAQGVTKINPATPGYCVDGQSAKCPPTID